MSRFIFVLVSFSSLLLIPVISYSDEGQKSIDASALAPAAVTDVSMQNIRQDMNEFQQALENEFRKAKVQYVLNQEIEKTPLLSLSEETDE